MHLQIGETTLLAVPVSFPGGHCHCRSDRSQSWRSISREGEYYLTTNGNIYFAVFVGLNAQQGYMTLAFDSPIKEFGG
jgi:hypothetical protein